MTRTAVWDAHLDDRRIACEDAKIPQNVEPIGWTELNELFPQYVPCIPRTRLLERRILGLILHELTHRDNQS